MAVLPMIFRRDAGNGDDSEYYTPLAANLVTALLIVMLTGLVLAAALFYMRYRRRKLAALRLEANYAFNSSSPTMTNMPQNASLCAPAKPSHHRRTKTLTTPPLSPVFVVGNLDEKDGSMGEYLDEKALEAGVHRRDSIPQIHLTFPEELDEKTGRRESRVVVVTVSDKGGVGLEPFYSEPLPAYSEKDVSMRDIDLERIGGLKESRN